MIDRKANIYEHTCISCNKMEVLKYPTYWHRTAKGSDKCNSCSKKGGNQASFKKGNPSWNKGTNLSGMSGKKQSEKFIKYLKSRRGTTMSAQARAKMRVAKLGKYGEQSNRWKGGVAKRERTILAARDEYKQWRRAVLARDNYTCQICLVRGGRLEADHIKEWANYPDLRYELDNGRTLCHDCHKTTDNYGFKVYARRRELCSTS